MRWIILVLLLTGCDFGWPLQESGCNEEIEYDDDCEIAVIE